MPKKTAYPRLRVHVKKGKHGQIWTSWSYDNRGTGEKDIPLGTDYAKAIERWKEIRDGSKKVAGTIEEAFGRWEKEVLPGYASAETRRGYEKALRHIRPVFGPARWDQIKFPTLKQYLRQRTGKTQANRELALLSVVWGWSRGEGLTELVWPAHGMEKAKWKNKEAPREREISDEAFNAIYRHADVLLQQALDIATATGLRVRDVLSLRLSDVRGSQLVVAASKTRKRAEFDITGSVVAAIVERRKLNKTAEHLFLLTNGRKPVTERMLNSRFAKARAAAEKECPEVAGLILRDMRKRAAQLAGDIDAASRLLQHSSRAVTLRHYGGGEKLKPTR